MKTHRYDPTKLFWHFYTCALPYWHKPSMFWLMLKKWFRWHAWRWDSVQDKWVRRKIWFCKPNPPVPKIPVPTD